MIESIKKFFIGAYEELKKVVWPSRKEVISHTIIVIVAIGVAMAIIATVDLGLSYLVQQLIFSL